MHAFTLSFADTLLHGDQLDCHPAQRQLLLLHGAGNASRAPFMPLRRHLQQAGIASTAFDFVGHGDTGGSLTGSSLEQRVAQTQAVMQARLPAQPLALLGSSMGAYIALRLLSAVECSHLILQVPGVYTPRAYHLPFGPAFSAVLRQPDSWSDSDAWDCLAAFRGHLLIVEASGDTVIPRALVDKLHASATRASSRQRLRLEGAGHRLAAHWQRHPAAASDYRRQLTRFLLQH